jgi:hypothetical protein
MSLCSQQKPTRGRSVQAARELIVARSRDRPDYTNLLQYMLGSPCVYAALDRLTTMTGSVYLVFNM